MFSFIPALMTLFRSSGRPGTDAEEYFDRGAGGVALYYSGGSTDYHTLSDEHLATDDKVPALRGTQARSDRRPEE